MPALGALASGVSVVSWDNRGIGQFIKSGVNGKIFKKDAEPKEVAKYILDLLLNAPLRKKFVHRGNREIVLKNHDRKRSVDEFITALEGRFDIHSEKYRIVCVTPHLRKHGGPTTILHLANGLAAKGHAVSITSLYSDVNPAVMEITELPIDLDPHKIPKCDLLITNSDNPMNATFVDSTQAKKKILLKLSHNARFKHDEEESLKLPWDAIVTSSEWLKKACEEPEPGWNHPGVEATRIGWFHYDHFDMKAARDYGHPKERPIVIGTLIHHHELKGTIEALTAMEKLKQRYGEKVHMVGIGEVPPGHKGFQKPLWMEYVYGPDRQGMANVLAQTDIWIGASHTEGLGRMALEAMSAGAACVLTNTGAEFAKDKFNCLIVPIKDPDAIVEAVDSLIIDENSMREIRIEGFRTAEAAADPDPTVDALEAVVQKVMK
jgi:glycosyltransferase involved in cell wall biosynthesis